MNRSLVCTALLSLLLPVASAANYHTNRELDRALTDAAGRAGSLIRVEQLNAGSGKEKLPLVRIGPGDAEAPAVLVVAGLDGRHLVGTEMALAVVRQMADDPSATQALLGGGTLYVLPRVNPYGADSYFSSPRTEMAGMPGSGDHDRDGLIGEDLFEDLNRDGRITLVRVRDAKGEFVLDGTSGEFPRRAKPEEGERGEWRLLSEGRDDDGDRAFNEEADGGVNLARNFTHGYEWFAKDAGRHQVSEPRSRAVADFIVEHPELAAVVVFGFEDNLLSGVSDKTSDPPLRGSRFGRKPVSQVNKHDVAFLKHLGERYRESLGLGKDATGLGGGGPGVTIAEVANSGATTSEHAAKGGLGEFVYYTRGRLALATPVWTPALQLALNRATEEKAKNESDAPEEDGGDSPAEDTAEETPDGAEGDAQPEVDATVQNEEAFRDWLVGLDPDGWVPWSSLSHPDFPGKETLAGGFAPFAKINPPAQVLPDLEDAHVGLVQDLLRDLPRVRIREAELTSRGGGVHELRVVVENMGYLPDVLAQGVFSAHVRDTRVEVDVPDGGEVLGGPTLKKLDRLPGSGGWEEVRFTLRLRRGSVRVRAVSEVGGRDTVTLRSGETVEGKQ